MDQGRTPAAAGDARLDPPRPAAWGRRSRPVSLVNNPAAAGLLRFVCLEWKSCAFPRIGSSNSLDLGSRTSKGHPMRSA